jgi:hypothetical protein
MLNWVGYIGGVREAAVLIDELRRTQGIGDEMYQRGLISAMAMIGGAEVVGCLLDVAERGTEGVQLAALTGVESLVSETGMALTDGPEPVAIKDEPMRLAAERCRVRLKALGERGNAPEYVRHVASEISELIERGLSQPTNLRI